MKTEAPALCYHCGLEIDDVTVSLYGSFCSGACSASVPRPPFRFTQHGIDYICSWHHGHDVTHPDNAGANHGMCPACIEREGKDWR